MSLSLKTKSVESMFVIVKKKYTVFATVDRKCGECVTVCDPLQTKSVESMSHLKHKVQSVCLSLQTKGVENVSVAADKICGKCLSLQTKGVECVFVTADTMCRLRVFCHCRQNMWRVCVCYSRQEV